MELPRSVEPQPRLDLSARPSESSRPSLGSLSRTELGCAALAILVLALRVFDLARHYGSWLLLDDAYISFRYAANFARGEGLVFNPGERVEGFTNFLWTVILASGDWIGLDIPMLSIVLAALATVGTLILLLLLGHRLFAESGAPWLAGVAPVLFALIGCQARYVVAGMETPLFVFLVTLGVFLALSGRSLALTGAVFALAAMTRPEGVLYFGLVCLFLPVDGMRERFAAWGRLALGFLVLALPYFLWRYSYYGYLLPNTFYVKAGSGPSGPLLQRGWTLFLPSLRQAGLELPLAFGLLALVLPARNPEGRRWRWLFASMVAATLVYVIGVGGDFVFFFGPRFLMPALPFALLLCALGLAAILRAVSRPALRRAVSAIALVILVVYAARFSWPGPAKSLEFLSRINESWTELGLWLRANTPPDTVIAVGAVGRIPYYSGLYTIDMLGLTDTHIAHLEMPLGKGMPGHEKFDTPYVLSRDPDYMIFPLLDPMGRPTLVGWSEHGAAIEERYEMVALVKAMGPPGPWVLPAAEWTPELAQRGYQGAVYRRREERVP